MLTLGSQGGQQAAPSFPFTVEEARTARSTSRRLNNVRLEDNFFGAACLPDEGRPAGDAGRGSTAAATGARRSRSLSRRRPRRNTVRQRASQRGEPRSDRVRRIRSPTPCRSRSPSRCCARATTSSTLAARRVGATRTSRLVDHIRAPTGKSLRGLRSTCCAARLGRRGRHARRLQRSPTRRPGSHDITDRRPSPSRSAATSPSGHRRLRGLVHRARHGGSARCSRSARARSGSLHRSSANMRPRNWQSRRRARPTSS